jgi:heme a synthase
MTLLRRLTLISLLLCAIVVVVGAHVRLTDAGLGCPDWPGCYGRVLAPTADHQVERVLQAFPDAEVDVGKAWREMIHRYLASVLGLLILAIALLSPRARGEGAPQVLPWALAGLVIFQGILGMWTVTLLLKPLVVAAHLLGGMATLSLLFWLWLSLLRPRPAREDRESGIGNREPRNERLAWALMGASGSPDPAPAASPPPGIRRLAGAALLLLVVQIFLGGWTSANYAALACTDVPTCHGQWWPEMDFAQGFSLWQQGLGVNYEFGLLENPARTAIHVTHRLGALVVTIFFGALALSLLLRGQGVWRVLGGTLLAALTLQVGIGISVVLLYLPLWLATLHNGGAAALLLVTVALNFYAWHHNQHES